MSSQRTLSVELGRAISELEATFPDASIEVTADERGGAWVTVPEIHLGPRWDPPTTWMAFHLAPNYPYADVYPLFMDGACRLASDGSLPAAVTANASTPTHEEPCLQVSRRSNHWDPLRDTAAIKVIKVRDWLASR